MLGCALVALSVSDARALTLLIQQNTNYNVVDQGQRLISAVPYDGQQLDAPPDAVTLTFTNGLKPDKSYIRVYNMYGTQLNDGKVQGTGKSMSVSLPPLAPGHYHVRWKAVCQCDADDLSDTLRFTVR